MATDGAGSADDRRVRRRSGRATHGCVPAASVVRSIPDRRHPRTMTTAVYFDLDGTLVRFERHPDGWPAAVSEYVDVPIDEDDDETFFRIFHDRFDEFRGDPYLVAARDTVAEREIDVAPERLATAYKRSLIDAVAMPESVRKTLREIVATYPTGLLTNGYRSVQERKLEAATPGSVGWFDAFIGADDVGARKPDPRTFRAARDRIDADRYVYVGNSVDHDLPAGDHGFETVLVHIDDEQGPDDARRPVRPGTDRRLTARRSGVRSPASSTAISTSSRSTPSRRRRPRRRHTRRRRASRPRPAGPSRSRRRSPP
ncbi:hypothetical protein BRD17_02280 [Halobacteriales archaeon SW_7_68_16]|nr:MAG: hypothetical protein BRD17_02280 [Halobacteriales archaeon SW_7_68_16]